MTQFKVFRIIKFSVFVIFVALYAVTSLVLELLPLRYWWRTRIKIRVMSFFSKLTLSLLSIRVRDKEIIRQSLKNRQNSLFVSNHLSYLDVLVLAGYVGGCFVTSMEMKKTLFLGRLCRMGACLFVDRRSKANIHNEIREITDALSNDINVVIFPEATSTDGSSVLRFKRPLYQAAIDADRPVSPLCINYRSINSQQVSVLNRDQLFWYGDMEFFSHFWELLGLKRIEVEITLPQKVTIDTTSNIDSLSVLTHQIVSSQFRPILN